MNEHRLGPWPDLAVAQSFLGFLAGTFPSFDLRSNNINEEQVASWLIQQGIGPLAYARCRSTWPELSALLQADAFSASAENSLHWQNLEQIVAEFASANIPVVLLKGAALAETVYSRQDQRTMSDIDLWLQPSDVDHAGKLMGDLGFYTAEKEERPREFQLMADGEIQFYHRGWQQSLAEFHLSPFSGWWLKRTASIDNSKIWSHKEPLNKWASVYQLSAEDTVIHLAVHMVINHQCGYWAIRSLMDLALTINKRTVDWDIVANRSKQWRVNNPVWLALQLLQQLFGSPGLDYILKKLCPSYWRRLYLQTLVTAKSIILGEDLRSGRTRYLFLLLLVDRKRDMVRLTFRTLWPEKNWLLYRYNSPVSHWQHLNRVIRHDRL